MKNELGPAQDGRTKTPIARIRRNASPQGQASQARKRVIRLIAILVSTGLVLLGIGVPARAEGLCAQGLRCMELVTGRAPYRALSSSGGLPVISSRVQDFSEASSWMLSLGPDSSFTITTRDNPNGCLDANAGAYIEPWGLVRSDWRAALYGCNGGDRQKWFFQPVQGSDTDFYIRNVANTHCLQRWGDTTTVGHGACDGSAHQRWTLKARDGGSDSDYVTRARKMALNYAVERCSANPSTCRYEKTGETPPALVGFSCASDIKYNGTGAPETYTLTTSKAHAHSYGFTEGSSIEVSNGPAEGALWARVKVTLSISANQQWSETDSNSSAETFILPDGRYGYVLLSRVASTVTGTFTFDSQGIPWIEQATVQILLKDTAAGSTYYKDITSSTLPTCTENGSYHP